MTSVHHLQMKCLCFLVSTSWTLMWTKCSLRQGMTYVRFWKDKWSRNHSLNEMSQTLNMALKALLSIKQSLNTIVTIFCPTDKAFYSLKHSQVPFTLLQYQIAPSNHDKETLENSLTYGSKVSTLLLGHPPVVTTLPDDTNTSINGVKIVDWDNTMMGMWLYMGWGFLWSYFSNSEYPRYDGEDFMVFKFGSFNEPLKGEVQRFEGCTEIESWWYHN